MLCISENKSSSSNKKNTVKTTRIFKSKVWQERIFSTELHYYYMYVSSSIVTVITSVVMSVITAWSCMCSIDKIQQLLPKPLLNYCSVKNETIEYLLYCMVTFYWQNYSVITKHWYQLLVGSLLSETVQRACRQWRLFYLSVLF